MNASTPTNQIVEPSKPPVPPGVLEKLSTFITKLDKRLLTISFFTKVPLVARRLLIIGGLIYLGIIIIFIFIALLVAVFRTGNGGSGTQIPLPPKVTPAPAENRNSSIYATDSAVLQLESGIMNLDDSLKDTDVSESVLGVPNLNFDVNF